MFKTAASIDKFSFDHPRNQDYGDGKRLTYLQKSDSDYSMLEMKFLDGWKHPHKQKPHVHGIYKILSSEESLKPFHKYRASVAAHPSFGAKLKKNPANEQLLFHGTTRSCSLVEDRYNVRLCGLPWCLLCCVIDQSFDIAKCGTKHTFSRFGTGIYTSACSSKADDYTSNMDVNGTLRVLLVNRVIVGKPFKELRNATNLTELPYGYHSLIGNPGFDLNYCETVVYSNDAIRPAFLIVYGDAPPPKSQTNLLVKPKKSIAPVSRTLLKKRSRPL